MCLCGGVECRVWGDWVAGRAVLGDTAVLLPGSTWGHRTHQTTILLEVSLSFSLSLQGSLYVLIVVFATTKAWHGKRCWGKKMHLFECLCIGCTCSYFWVRGQLGQGAAGEWKETAKEGGVGVDGFVELDGSACVSGAAWLGLACLLACWGGINVSLVWGGVWGVVWLGCGMGCAGRHGGAPASPYVGASHTPDDDLA